MFCSQHSKKNATYATTFETEDGLVFDASKLSMMEPTTKTIQVSPTQSSNYYEMYPMYDCGKDIPRLEPLQMQGYEMTCYGLLDGTSGKPNDVSINVRLYKDNAEALEFMDTVYEIHNQLAQILYKFRGKVGLINLNKEMPNATGFKHPFYIPYDKNTGDVIEGKPPSIYLKLFSRGSGLKEEKTVFMGINGKEIPWDALRNVQFSFIPLLKFEKIYIGGGRASLQIKLVSAIVTKMESKSAVGLQMGTLKRFQSDESRVREFDEEFNKRLNLVSNASSSQASTSTATAAVASSSTSSIVHGSGSDSPALQSLNIAAIPDFASILNAAPKK